MGKVMMSGVAPQMKAPLKSFADTSWADIITACQTNTVPSKWLVGDQKSMTINGTDYTIDIIGKNHDTYSDDSGTAPLTFQLHEVFGTTDYSMNDTDTNVGGWGSCSIRTSLLPNILGYMPSEVMSGIKQVKKLTSSGNNKSTIVSSSDSLFLLSEIEIFGSTKYSFDGEGTQYEYYKAGNSAKKTTATGASATNYWQRSPAKGFTDGFCVTSNGSYGRGSSSGKNWVTFAFCF